MGQPFALDYSAVLLMGMARGVDIELLSDVLPAVESEIIAALNGDGGSDPDDEPDEED